MTYLAQGEGLGFSLKPPKALRKLTLKKAVSAVGKVASIAAPFVIPALAPLKLASLAAKLPGAATLLRGASLAAKLPGVATAARGVALARKVSPFARPILQAHTLPFLPGVATASPPVVQIATPLPSAPVISPSPAAPGPSPEPPPPTPAAGSAPFVGPSPVLTATTEAPASSPARPAWLVPVAIVAGVMLLAGVHRRGR